MSTEIGKIYGRKEDESDFTKTTISLNRFWGGVENGRMLQITINNKDGYIQLTKDQTIELARMLLNSFDDSIYPSE